MSAVLPDPKNEIKYLTALAPKLYAVMEHAGIVAQACDEAVQRHAWLFVKAMLARHGVEVTGRLAALSEGIVVVGPGAMPPKPPSNGG